MELCAQHAENGLAFRGRQSSRSARRLGLNYGLLGFLFMHLGRFGRWDNCHLRRRYGFWSAEDRDETAERTAGMVPLFPGHCLSLVRSEYREERCSQKGSLGKFRRHRQSHETLSRYNFSYIALQENRVQQNLQMKPDQSWGRRQMQHAGRLV